MNVKGLRAAALLLAVIFGTWAGLWVYSSRPQARPTAPTPPAVVQVPVGEASPPGPSDLDESVIPPPTIPDRLPDFSLPDRTGKPTPIAAWRGKSLIINFWATWCAPCRKEIPLLQAVDREWHGRDVEVIGIAVDFPDKMRAFADELKITYPLLVGEEDALDAARSFGMATPVFPFTVFTDRQGDVVALYIGELHRAQIDLILSVVQNLNQGKVHLPDARRLIAEGLHSLR